MVHVHVALVQYVRDELVSNPYIVIHVLCLFVVVSLVPRFRCSTFMFVVRLQLTIVQTKIDQTSNFHHRREEAANDTRRNQIYRAIWGRQQEVQRGLNRVGIRRFIQIKKDIVEFRYPEEGASSASSASSASGEEMGQGEDFVTYRTALTVRDVCQF